MNRFPTHLSLTAILTAGLGVSGCAMSLADRNQAAIARYLDRTVIVVENRNWRQVEVYLTLGAARQRLGLVGPMSSTRFDVTVPIGGTARVQVRPVGSTARFDTEGVHLAAATWLDLIITADASQSILIAR